MRLIAAVPVKNEAWILPTTLATFQELFDIVIVADQQSTDATPEICSRFSKVVRIENPARYLDDGNHYQLLLDAARSYDGDNVIFALDADEMLTGSALDGNVMDRVCGSLQPGACAEIECITLWKSVSDYRVDDPRFAFWGQCIYRDDRRLRFEEGRLHRPRVPLSALANPSRFDEPKLLHFSYAFWDRLLAKHRWYRMLERVYYPEKDVQTVNATYIQIVKDEQSADLKPLPEEWISAWTSRGIELPQRPHEQISWHELDALRMFREHGLSYFAGVDIWDADWEERRQAALSLGHADVPDEPIRDPRRPTQRFDQAFIRRFHHRTPWTIAQSRVRGLIGR